MAGAKALIPARTLPQPSVEAPIVGTRTMIPDCMLLSVRWRVRHDRSNGAVQEADVLADGGHHVIHDAPLGQEVIEDESPTRSSERLERMAEENDDWDPLDLADMFISTGRKEEGDWGRRSFAGDRTARHAHASEEDRRGTVTVLRIGWWYRFQQSWGVDVDFDQNPEVPYADVCDVNFVASQEATVADLAMLLKRRGTLLH